MQYKIDVAIIMVSMTGIWRSCLSVSLLGWGWGGGVGGWFHQIQALLKCVEAYLLCASQEYSTVFLDSWTIIQLVPL